MLVSEFRRRYRCREMIVLKVKSLDNDQIALVCPLSSVSTDQSPPFDLPFDAGGASCGELRCVEIDNTLCLYNPSTRAWRRLPALTCPPRIGATIEGYSTSVFAYGLGYDSSSDDHKILKIHLNLTGKTEMYSLRSDSWRELKGCRTRIVRELCTHGNTLPLLLTPTAAFADGALHWLVHDRNCNVDPRTKEAKFFSDFVLLTFDVSTEEFGKVAAPLPLPETFPKRACLRTELDVCMLGGRLSVCMNHEMRFVVWVMEDDRWKKDLEIDYGRIQPLCYSYLRPLYFYDGDGRVIKAVTSSTDNRKLFICKQEEDEEEEGCSSLVESRSFGSNGYDIVVTFTYVESLVSPFPYT